jgi:small subunit ribosomal protein S8
MTMTDPVADMLTRVRNASIAYHETTSMPSSKIKVNIAKILEQEGYIAGWTRGGDRATADADDPDEVRPEP